MPTIFVTHLPKELVPLAKLSPDDPPARTKPLRRGEGPTTVEVFECCINGQEISPGYSHHRFACCSTIARTRPTTSSLMR